MGELYYKAVSIIRYIKKSCKGIEVVNKPKKQIRLVGHKNIKNRIFAVVVDGVPVSLENIIVDNKVRIRNRLFKRGEHVHIMFFV